MVLNTGLNKAIQDKEDSIN